MKIGVFQSSCPSPSEIFIYNQIAELQKLGYEVRLLGYRSKQATPELRAWYREQIGAPMFHPWPTTRNQLIRSFLRRIHELSASPQERIVLRRLIKAGRPGAAWLDPAHLYFWGVLLLQHRDLDVILAHFAPVGGVVAVLKECGVVSCPLVAALHGADVTSKESERHIASGLYPRLWKEAAAFTYNSSFIRDRAIAMGFPSNAMQQVQMAVGSVFLEPLPERRRFPTPFRVLSVGRFVEKKGHLTGLKAFRELLRTQADCEYTIIGDGPLRGQMEEFIAKADLGSKVHLPGALTQDHVRQAMLDADVFLFPSETASNGDMEGQGLVVQEAQACGLPVIVTRHNGVPDGMVEGATGFVVEERDHIAMARQLGRFISNQADIEKMGSAARQFVLKQFSGATLARKLESVLNLATSSHSTETNGGSHRRQV